MKFPFASHRPQLLQRVGFGTTLTEVGTGPKASFCTRYPTTVALRFKMSAGIDPIQSAIPVPRAVLALSQAKAICMSRIVSYLQNVAATIRYPGRRYTGAVTYREVKVEKSSTRIFVAVSLDSMFFCARSLSSERPSWTSV